MISSNPISAPHIERGSYLYDGRETLAELYDILTTPCLRREEILANGDYEINMNGRILYHTVRGVKPEE